ncbi:ornithine cyclodeaminase family protein [Microbacterium sp. RD1]|uniref:ornithine cyclodeaminase family protein n=1 Tax=Microbacterium sp. RD1 TaxID=3457313 RepID=UPI003FA598B6
MSLADLVLLDEEQVFAAVPWRAAVDALRAALLAGLDPAAQPARTAAPVRRGELLFMPAEHGKTTGAKLLSVAPHNAGLSRPRIQGIYLLMDAETLTPRALLDGTALTTLRTPALAAVAVDALAPADAHRLVVFGSGPQAEGAVHAFRAVRPIDSIRIVSRRRESADALVRRLAAQGIAADAGEASDVAGADLIAAATSSVVPVLDGTLIPEHAVVTAVGSHHPDARELDAALLARAAVVVEDAGTALREAGDVVMAIAEGALRAEHLVTIGEVVRDRAHPARADRRRGPAVFKSVGQGWQDLVLARAAYDAGKALRG